MIMVHEMILITDINTIPETNSSPLKIGRAPKGNDRIPTIHSQVLKTRWLRFREGRRSGWIFVGIPDARHLDM